MAEKKIYIGSFGPALYLDDESIDDPDGDFSGETQQGVRCDGSGEFDENFGIGGDLDVGGDADIDGAVTVGSIKLDDTDDSNTLEIKWNENAAADYILNLLVGGGTRSLTLNGNLTVELASVLNQDLTTDASPTFANLSLGTGELTAGSINRASGSLTLEVGGVAQVTIATTELTVTPTLLLSTCIDAGADVDKFLVLDASNNVDYRTGAEVLSDIGAMAAAGGTFTGCITLTLGAPWILLHDTGTNVGHYILSCDITESSGYGEFSIWRCTGAAGGCTLGDNPPIMWADSSLNAYFNDIILPPDGTIGVADGNPRITFDNANNQVEIIGNLVLPANGIIGVTDGNPQIAFDNANNWLEITGKVAIGTATPTDTVELYSTATLGIKITKSDRVFRLYNDGQAHLSSSGGSIYLDSNTYALGVLDADILTGQSSIRLSSLTYATAGNPLTTSGFLQFCTWVWNGSNGYTTKSEPRITATQLDYTSGHVRVDFRPDPASVAMSMLYTGEISIGTTASGAKLHIDQASDTAAIPVLTLDQADVSEEMIEFITTVGVGNAIEAVDGKTLTTTHFIRVTVPGPLSVYLPVGTIA